MLELRTQDQEFYDDEHGFIEIPGGSYVLEHSLISVSKWESKWHIPFLSTEEKTDEQVRDYIRCMFVKPPKHKDAYLYFSLETIREIAEYINEPMTATTFSELSKRGGFQIITNEVIYYWMVACNIPFECDKWHLNRLLTLIKVVSLEMNPKKQMDTRDILEQNRRINEMRKKKYNTNG